jgi:WD40 repeat protein
MNHMLTCVWIGLTVVSSLNAAGIHSRGTLEGHSDEVNSVAWSPDGKTLASGGGDRTIKLWNVEDRKCIATFKADPINIGVCYVTSVAWSPNGKTLASGCDDTTIRLWDISTGKNTATLMGHTAGVISVAWRPDGKTLVSGGGDGTVRLWDIATGKNTVVNNGADCEVIRAVAWSPNGDTFASGDSASNTIKLWSATSGKCSVTITSDEQIASLAFSPNGKTLASGGNFTIEFWDAMRGTSIAILEGHSSEEAHSPAVYGNPSVYSVAFSPDGRTLASGGDDKTIKLWDVASGKTIVTLTEHTRSVASVAWSPDGKTLASASHDKTIKLWNVTTPEEKNAERSLGGKKAVSKRLP